MQHSVRSFAFVFLTGVTVTLLFTAVPASEGAMLHTCNGNDLEQCALSADSLLKDPNLVFPDSPSSLDRVCRTWTEFTACIYSYTKSCFTPAEKSRFDEQFKEPATSMNTLCQDQAYRREYFKVAPCIQKITTNEQFCGFQYRFLIDQISGSVVTMKQLCCAREKFRQCILQKTDSICAGEDKFFGRQRPGELNSTTFAIQVLDKSLAFIAQQCSSPSIQHGDCPGTETPPPFYKGTRYDRPPSPPSGGDRSKNKDTPIQPPAQNNIFLTGNIYGGATGSKSPEYKVDASNSTGSGARGQGSSGSRLNEVIKTASFGNGNRRDQVQGDQPSPQQGQLSRTEDTRKNGAPRDYSHILTIISAIGTQVLFQFIASTRR